MTDGPTLQCQNRGREIMDIAAALRPVAAHRHGHIGASCQSCCYFCQDVDGPVSPNTTGGSLII